MKLHEKNIEYKTETSTGLGYLNDMQYLHSYFEPKSMSMSYSKSPKIYSSLGKNIRQGLKKILVRLSDQA